MASHSTTATGTGDGRFATTDWRLIVAARGTDQPVARKALAELCEAYWYPVYALIRQRGHDPEKAADLTQDYFARLLEKRTLSAADPVKGRFRSFLRTDCGYFLADARDRENALKRGGGAVPVSIDARDAEGRHRFEPVDDLTPERLFDRAWALTVLGRAMDRLAGEYAARGRFALFEHLEPTLSPGPDAEPYASIAARLGLSLAAVHQAASRLRSRYRALLREEVGATVDGHDKAAVDDEIRDLFAALGG
jgi:DNA-directed RNA polymerase specialized sigma24 family protein